MTPTEQAARSGRYIRDLNWLNWPVTPESMSRAYAIGSDSLLVGVLLESLHKKRGIQLRVSKEVSDDMLLTDMGNVGFGDVPWPAQSVEVFFEDKGLPTVLLSKCHADDLEKVVGGGFQIHQKKGERVMIRLDKADDKILTFNVSEDLWERLFIEGDDSAQLGGSLPLESEEGAVLRFMTRLAFKVFAYISLPQYASEKVPTITKSMGGKPGYKGRPSRPVRRAIYLPAIHTPRDEESVETGIKHEFRGRRGFFRLYKHERYKEMRGKRQFIAPVRVEGKSPAVYQVRKPTEAKTP